LITYKLNPKVCHSRIDRYTSPSFRTWCGIPSDNELSFDDCDYWWFSCNS